MRLYIIKLGGFVETNLDETEKVATCLVGLPAQMLVQQETMYNPSLLLLCSSRFRPPYRPQHAARLSRRAASAPPLIFAGPRYPISSLVSLSLSFFSAFSLSALSLPTRSPRYFDHRDLTFLAFPNFKAWPWLRSTFEINRLTSVLIDRYMCRRSWRGQAW